MISHSALHTFLYLLPEALLGGLICFLLLFGAFVPSKQVWVPKIAQSGLLLIAVLTWYFVPHVPVNWFEGQLLWDPLAFVLTLFLLLSAFCVSVYSSRYTQRHRIPIMEYDVLALIALLGMLVMVASSNLISLYLGLECMSLPLYAMIALQRNQFVRIEAAMKYFLIGAFASAFLLYGFSLLFAATGTLSLKPLAAALLRPDQAHLTMALLGLVFTAAGICFKMGAAPFHMWVPDVYEGAPTQVTLFISSLPKLGAFALLVRILMHTLPSISHQWHEIILIVAVLSLVIGNLLAVIQDNIKRMLAYSSIAHMGYLLLAFSMATIDGENAALFYLLTYMITTIATFGLLTLLSQSGHEVENIDDLRGLSNSSPWFAFLMLLLMFSMAGVPPIVGFIAKLRILEVLVAAHYTGLAVITLLFAVIGAYYYLRVVKVMYFSDESHPNVHGVTNVQSCLLSVNTLAVLVIGILPAPLFSVCHWVLSYSF